MILKVSLIVLLGGMILDSYTKLLKKREHQRITQIMVKKTTGNKSLILVDYGENKAVVIATIRQLIGVDITVSDRLFSSVPVTILQNISQKEAELDKEALEYVGAKIKIK